MPADDQSTVDELKPPTYENSLPPHIVSRLSSDELWLFERIGDLQHSKDWLVSTLVYLQNIIIKRQERRLAALELKLKTLEETKIQAILDWKLILTTKMGLLAVFGMALLSALLSAAARALFAMFTGK